MLDVFYVIDCWHRHVATWTSMSCKWLWCDVRCSFVRALQWFVLPFFNHHGSEPWTFLLLLAASGPKISPGCEQEGWAAVVTWVLNPMDDALLTLPIRLAPLPTAGGQNLWSQGLSKSLLGCLSVGMIGWLIVGWLIVWLLDYLDVCLDAWMLA